MKQDLISTAIAILLLSLIFSISAIILTKSSINFKNSIDSKEIKTIDSTESKNIDFTNISTEDVYKIFRKVPVGTKVCDEAVKELERRHYWDEEERQKEKRAQEIYDEYTK